jgi:outer membrane protein assembly factor BamB
MVLVLAAAAAGAEWNQFRGPNATGEAGGGPPLPAEIGPGVHEIWKSDLPPGHSSPVLDDKNVYLTAADGEKLLVFALDRRTGEVVWRDEAPVLSIEEIHRIGSLAQASPATDGEVVVSFFGSSGLAAHSATGERLWHLPMGPFKNNFGAGSSPILAGDWVILNQDHDTDSFLMAVDKRTGQVVWRTDRSEFPRSYATPVLWDAGGRRQIVVSGTLRVVGYDFETGREAWTVRGTSRIVNMTPIAAPNGVLYVPAWAPGADDGERIQLAPWAEALEQWDADGDGSLSEEEIPPGETRQRFNQIDRDKDGRITQAEYENMSRVFDEAKNALIAVRPGGEGDVTDTHVLWTQSRQLPYVPTPVFVDGFLYMVKNAGVFTVVDASTGAIGKSGRVSGRGAYYASPVAGDGKIYVVDENGVATVVSAGPDWRVLSSADFGERVHATPAISDGRIYFRTESRLYCFGE